MIAMRLFTGFIHNKLLELVRQVDIDQLLVLNGYSYLDALIKKNNKLFGGSVSKQRKELLLNEKTLRVQKEYLYELSDKHKIDGVGNFKDEALFEKILSDERLFQHVKSMVLHRYFREQYEELIAPYEGILEEKRLDEYNAVCRCYLSNENEPLGSLDKIDKRRAVYNDVTEDVFLPYGFTKRTTSSGFFVMHKLISDEFALIISPDTVNLKKYYQYSGALNMDHYLGAAKKSDKSRYYNFQYPRAYFAFDIYRNYQDVCSMEVAIRANGLFYEAVEMKLEEYIKQYPSSTD
jgi:hypothetical protein